MSSIFLSSLLPVASAAYSAYSAIAPAATGPGMIPAALLAAASVGMHVVPVVKETMALLLRRKAFVELVAEVNAAIKYTTSVRKWLRTQGAGSRVCPREKEELEQLLLETWKFIDSNFLLSKDFERALQEDTRIVEILQELDTYAPRQQKQTLQDLSGSYFLGQDPTYYRQELVFRMVRVIETLKELTVHQILNPDATCRGKENYVTLESGAILVEESDIKKLLQKVKGVYKGSRDDASSATVDSGSDATPDSRAHSGHSGHSGTPPLRRPKVAPPQLPSARAAEIEAVKETKPRQRKQSGKKAQ